MRWALIMLAGCFLLTPGTQVGATFFYSAAAAGGGGITEVGSGTQRAISNTTTGAQDSKALAFPGSATTGDFLVVGGAIWTSGGTTVAPTVTTGLAGTTFTVNLADATPSGTTWRTFMAYAVAGASGACTVTVNPNGASSDFCFGIDEFSGVTALDVDGSDSTAATSSGPAQDSITTVAASTLILGVVSNETGAVMTPNAGYTQIAESEAGASNQPINFHFRIVTSAGANTPGCTLGGSTTWQCQTLSFKP